VLIDWFTVGAQLLNFIVLVWLMKRFLYKPVLDAIAAREQKIAAELADAAAMKVEAQREREEFQKKNQAFDEQRAELLRQATDEANVERERLQGIAREAADAASAQRAKALQSDVQHLHAEIARQAQLRVFDISRRVLDDLAAISLEERACAVFVARLRAMEGPALAALSAALETVSDTQPAVLRSAFDLPALQGAAIQAALDGLFGRPIPLEFETAPELVCGIELRAQGQKFAWSIADYLDELASGMDALVSVAATA
jgi:F-type H+-transporting ATPase subunit b